MPPRRNSLLADFTSVQIKNIENAFIEYLKLEGNRFIYDTRDPNYSNTQLRNQAFQEFGSTLEPTELTVEQVTYLYNLLLNRYNTASNRYRNNPQGTVPQALTILNFFECRRPISTPISVNSIVNQNQNNSSTQNNSSIQNNSSTRNQVNSNLNPNQSNPSSNLNPNQSNPNSNLNQSQDDLNSNLNQSQDDLNSNLNQNQGDLNSNLNQNQDNTNLNQDSTRGLEPPRDRYNRNRRSRLADESNQARRNQMREYEVLGGIVNLVNQNQIIKLSKNPQISGFQISLGRLLDEYAKLVNEDTILLEMVKAEITSIVTDKIVTLNRQNE